MAQHPEARAWTDRALAMLGHRPKLAVEVGSRILHPNDPHDPRPDVRAEKFIGVDCNAGLGVDVVSVGHEYTPPGPVDLALSLQALEHDPYWRKTLLAMASWLAPGGVVCVSCAGPGCPTHEPEHSPEPGHYGVVSSDEIADVLRGAGLVDTIINDGRTHSMGVPGGWVRSRVLARRPDFTHAWAIASQISSAVTEVEAQVLWGHAVRRPSCIVEIGSWHGRMATLLGWAVAAPGGRVTTVDPFDGSRGVGGTVFHTSNEHILRQNLAAHAPLGVVDYVHDRSAALGLRWSGPPVSLLWVDGDHTPQGVRADLAAWLPHLAPDARIALHDCHLPGPAGVFETATRQGWRVVDAAPGGLCLRVIARR